VKVISALSRPWPLKGSTTDLAKARPGDDADSVGRPFIHRRQKVTSHDDKP
jgi:hypothetical protein